MGDKGWDRKSESPDGFRALRSAGDRFQILEPFLATSRIGDGVMINDTKDRNSRVKLAIFSVGRSASAAAVRIFVKIV